MLLLSVCFFLAVRGEAPDYFSLRPEHSFHWESTTTPEATGSGSHLVQCRSSNYLASTEVRCYWNELSSSTMWSSGASTANSTTPGPKQTHLVDVGPSNELVFKPNQLDAATGDFIQFNFLALNHTLTQSDLQNPCTNGSGFDTGFNQFNPQNITGKFLIYFKVEVGSPQWFYCAQTVKESHCEAGMVFGLNTAGRMGQFLSNAVIENSTALFDPGNNSVTLIASAGISQTGQTFGTSNTTISHLIPTKFPLFNELVLTVNLVFILGIYGACLMVLA